MSKETGGPAFPLPHGSETTAGCEGLTLRDYFAAKAMQGILANPAQLDNINNDALKWISKDAYKVADAMLEARKS